MRVYDRILETDLIKEQNILPDEMYHSLRLTPENTEVFLDSYLSFVHPEDLQDVKDLLKISEELGTDTVWEHRIVYLGGEVRYIYARNKYELDHSGGPARLLRIFQDVTEKKLMEESLRKSEANLRTMFNNSDNAYILFDTDMKIVLYNHLAEQFALDELGKTLVQYTYAMDYFPSERRNFIMDQMTSAMGGQKVQYEVSYMQVNGSEKWYSVRFFPVLNEDRHVSGIIMALFEITSLKNAHKEKEFESNNLFSLINNTNDMIWSVDKDFKLISSNNAFDGLISSMAGKVPQKGESILIAEFGDELINKYKDYYERAFSGEKFKITDVVDSPVETWSEISFYPIHKNGEVIGTACYAHDITTRKKFEKELEETNLELLATQTRLEYNESRLNQAQAIAHVGSWELSFSGGYSKWSDEAYRIYGVEPGDHKFTVEDWISFLHPGDLEKVKSEMERARATLSDSVIYHRIVQRDGTVRHARSESRFELNSEGIPVGLYGVVHDITEIQHNEMKLKNSLEVTNRQNKRLQNFAYIVSHNIRSHSANINGLLSVMEENGGVPENEKSFGMLRTSALQL
jgi:PAS domain S-box-containing protein